MNEIKQILISEKDKFIDCMTAAFVADPTFRFAFPKSSAYFKHFPLFANLYCGPTIENGSAWTINRFAGVSGWLEPGESSDDEAIIRFAFKTCEPDHWIDIKNAFEILADCHPKEPHWYLPMIGIDPIQWRCGLGNELMMHTIKKVETDNIPAYLESSNPLNISLYQRFGFEPIRKIELGGQHILTPMLRVKKK